MRIFPQDLGTKRHVELVYRRANASMGTQQAISPLDTPPTPRMGRLGRFWARGSGLTPEQAKAALPAASTVTALSLYLGPPLWAFFASLISFVGVKEGNFGALEAGLFTVASSGAAAYLGALGGRLGFRGLHRKPLKVSEVEALSTAHDDLERAYLNLVIHAIRQEVPPDAEKEVRETLRTLGESIAQLPAVLPATEEPDELLREVAALRAQAGADADPVVAESLSRQADSLQRRADTIRRTAQVVRRATVVRRELLTQVETLNTALAAFHTGAGDTAGLTELATAVRQVAVEADSLAAAREELDAAGVPPLPSSASTEQTVVPLRRQ